MTTCINRFYECQRKLKVLIHQIRKVICKLSTKCNNVIFMINSKITLVISIIYRILIIGALTFNVMEEAAEETIILIKEEDIMGNKAVEVNIKVNNNNNN